jgi:RNA polymerase-binding transcription factor DksA
MLVQKKLGQLRQRLLRRLDEVRADIRRELRKYDNETYGELADRVADAGEQSVADLLVDLDLAEVDRDVAECREIEAALLRLADGSYGSCVDCEEPIDAQRLENSPAVSRCYGCQQRFEHRDREVHHRTL